MMLLSVFQLCFVFAKGVFALPNEFYVDYNEIEQVNNDKRFGDFVRLSLSEKDVSTANEKKEEYYVTVKLFGFLPVKKIKAKLLPEENVFVGGELIGLSVHSNGAVVVSNSVVDEANGKVVKSDYFKNGDVICQINDKKIEGISDIVEALKDCNENADICLLRDNKKIKNNVGLLKDKDGNYKLGIWGRDEFSGIGTLTFVKNDNSFGALGHAITNGNNENVIPVKDGNVYDCALLDICKGEKNNPGQLKCIFIPKNPNGEIYKNTKQGIYGKIQDVSKVVDPNYTGKLGGRLSVKPGKAKIVSCLSGIKEEYEIEIIKTNYQSSLDEKSIVFRVTDERLLSLTGGIVQGMSGSPILQNGKVVGAVTHVFMSDPTKGYGIYTDWMLEQASM